MNQPAPPTLLTFDPKSLGSNPWDSTIGSDTAAQQAMQQSSQSNIAGLNSQLTALGGTPTTAKAQGYPAMSNAYGLGSQPSPVASGTASATPAPALDTTTRGANPWSLSGEANAR